MLAFVACSSEFSVALTYIYFRSCVYVCVFVGVFMCANIYGCLRHTSSIATQSETLSVCLCERVQRPMCVCVKRTSDECEGEQKNFFILIFDFTVEVFFYLSVFPKVDSLVQEMLCLSLCQR